MPEGPSRVRLGGSGEPSGLRLLLSLVLVLSLFGVLVSLGNSAGVRPSGLAPVVGSGVFAGLPAE
jgi:hypothetical protein